MQSYKTQLNYMKNPRKYKENRPEDISKGLSEILKENKLTVDEGKLRQKLN